MSEFDAIKDETTRGMLSGMTDLLIATLGARFGELSEQTASMIRSHSMAAYSLGRLDLANEMARKVPSNA